MSARSHNNILTIALALREPSNSDWTASARPETATNLRVTEDTALVARLRAQRLAEVLQAPARGRQPITGRPKYIVRLHPNADAPVTSTGPRRIRKRASVVNGVARIPFHLLASFAEAALSEWTRQRAGISRELEQEITRLESELMSTRDRNEKKRIADALQTALHADESLDAAIAKRVYTKLANSEKAYSAYVEAVDWSARR